MPFFTFTIRSETGEPLCEMDFTAHELIPLVRHLTRRLAARGKAEDLAGARAVVTPRYGGTPDPRTFYRDGETTFQPAGPAETLQISEEELDTLAPASFEEELEAYYNPGTSRLCLACPERHRCPGSGAVPETPISDWIVFDPLAPHSGEPLAYFTLRILSARDERLYQRDFGLTALQAFLSLAATLLHRAGRLVLPPSGRIRTEIACRYDGQPRLEPILAAGNRPAVRSRSARAAPSWPRRDAERGRRLVDWDRLESGLEALEPSEVEVKILDSETQALSRRAAPEADRLQEVGAAGGSPLQVFLRRSVLRALQAGPPAGRGELGQAGGLLAGEAYLRASDGLRCVEVVGTIPATDALGNPARMTLDSGRWRAMQAEMSRSFPSQSTVGWYRCRLAAGGQPPALSLEAEEEFMHRCFFLEPWQVGLIVDPASGEACFYRREGQAIVSCSGYLLLD